MADYVSSLTGVAMDAALIDMAEHTSEAYAVGERNGVPVDSGDVAYHNNARYYAQQAQSIAPASVTEAVRWDVAQTALTDAQREQARENIKATSHNPNLVDNGWFTAGNVINSRQIAYGVTINGSKYGIDRWIGVGNGYTLAATGVTIPSGGVMVQKKDWSGIANKTVTFSALGSNGTIGTWTGTFATGQFTLSNNMGSGTIVSVSQINIGSLGAEWAAFKFELGSFSTLAYDTPPDYGEELARCIYSTADPNDTYANNGFGRTNPNLIDNPWFTIQQRGSSAFTAAGYTADRWQKQGATGIVTPTANGLKFEKNGASYVEVRYYDTLDKYATIGNGKSFTLSILLQNGTVQHQSFVMASSGLDTNLYYAISSTNDFRVNLYTTSTLFVVRVLCYTDFTLRAIKLEQGTVSTLANDTPPDYGTELAKCQRYFFVLGDGANIAIIGSGFAGGGGTDCVILCPTPVTMRAKPTGAITVYPTIRYGTTQTTATAMTVNTVMQNGVALNFTCPITAYSPCCAFTYGKITLSADL